MIRSVTGRPFTNVPEALPKSWTTQAPSGSRVSLQCCGDTMVSFKMSWLEISRPRVSEPSCNGKTESRRGPLIAESLGFTGKRPSIPASYRGCGGVGGIVYIDSSACAIASRLGGRDVGELRARLPLADKFFLATGAYSGTLHHWVVSKKSEGQK